MSVLQVALATPQHLTTTEQARGPLKEALEGHLTLERMGSLTA